MITAASYLFGATFAVYLISALLYIARITLRRKDAKNNQRADRIGNWAFWAASSGVVIHLGAIVLRWVASGQAPMTNMFEYMSFLGWAVMLFFVLISYWYKLPALGAFVAPVGVIVIAYASVFPQDVKPLVPVLQSNWLVLHVTTAALGEGAFAVSFGAALMYLLRVRKEQFSALEERILETIFFLGTVLLGFLTTGLLFKLTGYSAAITGASDAAEALKYTIPPIIGPAGSVSGQAKWLGMSLPLLNAPGWMNGANPGKQLNTLLWSVVVGAIIYVILRLLLRSSLSELGTKAVTGMNPKLLDEVSYRGVAVGFPLFTLGAIVFAMIWAQKAWGSYWSWDPKETWALISWLFYSAYLHMRIVRGWEGKAAAWVSAAGFPLIIFTLVGVNLLISGMHSYAGG